MVMTSLGVPTDCIPESAELGRLQMLDGRPADISFILVTSARTSALVDWRDVLSRVECVPLSPGAPRLQAREAD